MSETAEKNAGAPKPSATKSPAKGGGAAKRAQPKSARRRSREVALQGLYEWLISGADAGVVDAHMREQGDFDKCDAAHFDALLHGCIAEAAEIDALLAKHVDRPTNQLSPIEHGVLMIGVYELKHCISIPYKVAINEAVELAKRYGAAESYKFVNALLDRAAREMQRDPGAAEAKA